MSNSYSTQPLTGKSARKQIQPVSEAMMLPVVFEDAVEKKGDVINDATKSGKQKGAMVAVEKADQSLYIAIARGSEPTDKWDATTMEVTPVTPAGD